MQGFSFGYQTELHSKDTLRIKLDNVKIIPPLKKDKGYTRLCIPHLKEMPRLYET